MLTLCDINEMVDHISKSCYVFTTVWSNHASMVVSCCVISKARNNLIFTSKHTLLELEYGGNKVRVLNFDCCRIGLVRIHSRLEAYWRSHVRFMVTATSNGRFMQFSWLRHGVCPSAKMSLVKVWHSASLWLKDMRKTKEPLWWITFHSTPVDVFNVLFMLFICGFVWTSYTWCF